MEKRIYIGTSGYFYSGWIGKFYPPEINSKDFLLYYQQFFNTVEINSTFYHMPKPSTMKSLKNKLKEDFKVSLKMPRIITHMKRLKNVEDELSKFFESVSFVKDNLGVILIQLPPSLKFDTELLKDFFVKLPKEFSFAIEFRHKTWLNDFTFSILKEFNVAFVITHGDNYPFLKTETSSIVYIRLHGPKELYASSYSKEELESWKSYIMELCAKGYSVYVYFNNDFFGYAVDNALMLTKMLA